METHLLRHCPLPDTRVRLTVGYMLFSVPNHSVYTLQLQECGSSCPSPPICAQGTRTETTAPLQERKGALLSLFPPSYRPVKNWLFLIKGNQGKTERPIREGAPDLLWSEPCHVLEMIKSLWILQWEVFCNTQSSKKYDMVFFLSAHMV